MSNGIVYPEITPHYRSEGRRQGSYAVLGASLTIAAFLAKLMAFLHLYYKTQFTLNMKSIFVGNVAIVIWFLWQTTALV